ncbi:hypothetical protein J7L48_02540 [bacterium]|nr:hypothetical protein [bacterium]
MKNNGIINKGKFTIISNNNFPLTEPFTPFSKNEKYHSIVLYFPSSFLKIEDINELRKFLTPKGTLTIIDFMKKSISGTIENSTKINQKKIIIENYFIIENLRENFRKLKYSVKKKCLGNYLWLFKISNEHLLHERPDMDYEFSKYPFAQTYRRRIFEISKELLSKNMDKVRIIYDGKDLEGLKTYDLYSPKNLINKQLFVAPFMYNALDTKGNLKKALKKWLNGSNSLIIPVLKRNFLNNHFNCKWVQSISAGLLTFESFQKIDTTFFLIEILTKSKKIWEYHQIKYHNPNRLNLPLSKLKTKNKMFNLYLLES